MKVLFILITILAHPIYSQNSHWVLGGSLGFGFGKINVVEVSPRIGYRLTPRLTTGVGVGYRYYNNRNYTPTLTQNIYSGLAYANYQFLQNLYAHSEFDITSYKNTLTPSRTSSPGLLAGVGYILGTGSSLQFTIEALYDLLYDKQKSYRSDPWVIRGGIRVNF